MSKVTTKKTKRQVTGWENISTYLQKTYNQKTERMNYKIVIKFKSEGSNKRVPKEDVQLVKKARKDA